MAISIDRILIPLDGSHRAELAVPYAAYIGAMLGAQMELVTVAEKPGVSITDLDQSVQRSLAEAEGFMTTWIRSIKTTAISGDPATAIVDHAGDGSTLVMMATHGRTGIMRRLAGSVAEGVLRATSSPVVLMRAYDNSANIRVPARVSKILVPLDMTDIAEGALPLSRLLAEKLSAEVTLLYVGEFPDSVQYLERVSGLFTGLKAGVKTKTVTGDPGRVIVEEADSLQSSMVVMCSKRANVASGVIRGSVTDYVVRHSNAPVAVVPYSIVGSPGTTP